MQPRIIERRRLEGWGFSLVLHGILLSAIVPAFRHLPAPIHSEPFRWNVMFVESSQQITPNKPGNDAPLEKEFLRTSQMDARNSISPPTGAFTSPKQEKIDHSRAGKESINTTPLLATSPPTLIEQPHAETSPQTPSTTQTTSVAQETLPDEQVNASMTTPPISPEPSTQPMATTEQEFLSNRASSATDAVMTPAQPMDVPSASTPPAPVVAFDQPSASQTDYSWLQRAGSRRLEELKQSSRPSLDDSSRLKVLVKAVVSNTGELMEAEVVKSSGLNRIDQEAMTLVHRAFPMPLDRTLDRQQIVMRIPITYSRD